MSEKRTVWNSTIERRKRLPRGTTPLPRGKPPRQRNARRKGHRFPKQVDEAYRRWIRQRPCLLRHTGECIGDVQACHVRARGCGGADRGNLWPGCAGHHAESHRGAKTFAAKYGLTLVETARNLDQWYESEEPPIW